MKLSSTVMIFGASLLLVSGVRAANTGNAFYGDPPDERHPWAVHDRNRPQPPKVLGCGGGHLALDIAARRAGAQVTGLDLSAEQVARAAARAKARGLAVQFVQGSALDLPFDSGSFDVVTSVASIKHWPDQARGLRECVRVLRAGGRLVVFEADRGCRLGDAQDFVRRWALPRPLRLPALAAFRTWVAGQAIDLDDARELVGGLSLEATEVRRVPGTPALMLAGSKPL